MAHAVWGCVVQDRRWIYLFFAGWTCSLVAGMGWFFHYETTAGAVSSAPDRLPTLTHLPFKRSRFTLMMFAHPQCPCTSVSLGELENVLAGHAGELDARIYFYQPGDATNSWLDTALWNKATQIPGLIVREDLDGTLAHRFGVETSGDTFLYDASGKLLFRGGITDGRGHAGANPGETALIANLNHQVVSLAKTPVFGCPLFEALEAEVKR